MIPEKLLELMKKQGYHIVGNHSAVKICKYTHDTLLNKTPCYKNEFYGIRSWRCLQATPSIACNLACRFCWRIIPEEIGLNWNELKKLEKYDEPKEIVEGMIEAQRKIVSGFKGNPKTNKKRWEEANDPAHATMSLTGEPLMYPYMSELLDEFHKRKMSTFVVSNGTLPEALEELETLPTQLYISMQAPNKEVYLNTVRPKISGAYEKFLHTLQIFSTLKTRRVLRMTLVRGLNLVDPEGYSKLIDIGKPDYVEVKAFVFVGGSRSPNRGLSLSDMPSMDEIRSFANKLAELTGYIPSGEHIPSRIVLLAKNKKVAERAKIKFKK